MKKATIPTILSLVLIGIFFPLQAQGFGRELSSRSLVRNNPPKTQKLSIDDIRKNYKEERRTVTQTYPYENYLLVESKLSEFRAANRFELFNLETGIRAILPTGIFVVQLKAIISENDLIFFAKGTNAIDLQVFFPFILECQRNDAREPFCATRKPAYLSIGQDSSFGNKKNEVLLNIRVTLEGVEILFGPMKGKEGEFWADYFSIPVASTKYAADKNQFIITFMSTKPDESISKNQSRFLPGNEYFSSLQINEIDGNCQVILNLTKIAKYYTGELINLKSSFSLPYVVLSFAEELPDDN